MMRSLVLTTGDGGGPDNLLTEVIDALDGPAKVGSTAGSSSMSRGRQMLMFANRCT
jgi:hypothetical protein